MVWTNRVYSATTTITSVEAVTTTAAELSSAQIVLVDQETGVLVRKSEVHTVNPARHIRI
jgi:hypothetical protein